MYSADIKRLSRQFLPQDFKLTDWASVAPYFEQLVATPIDQLNHLQKWLKNLSELEAVISEDACWRQIRMTCDTENKELEESYNFFCTEIQPHIQPYADVLNKKLLASKALHLLNADEYFTYLRSIQKNIDLFREENIPLQSEISVLQQQYGQITGDMMIRVNDQEYTLQQAAKFLENPDRALRQQVYEQIQERRLEDKEKLDLLFDKLVQLRNQEAHNAGFKNYRDYRFKELGRFDYSKEDCYQFHEAVKRHVIPLVNKILEQKKIKLGVENLRPWDLDAEPAGTNPLHPFENGKELLQKSVECFNKLNPFFGDCLLRMDQMKHFDLESRKGKSPGGYNCPLAESGAPFIFMNASGQMSDVTTMVHEGGHAIHSFLSHPLALTGFKEVPMEMAEVASMAMELFSMDEWDTFFKDEQELKRAKIHQLERVITIFPWIAAIDKFQHKLYENPHHTHQERTAIWVQVLQEFTDDIVDYSGLEKYRGNAWQRQLHLYEVPFYYIEYGIAQLGAIGMWKQFRENKKKALDHYCQALALGGTRTLPQLYRAAGIEFDFSPEKIKNLMQFVQNEMDILID